MTIEIRDADLEARIERQLQATGEDVEQLLFRLLHNQEEQDEWLLDNGGELNAKIELGREQLRRGEGIPEGELDAHLANLKSLPE